MNRPSHGGNLTWAASLAGCPANLIVDFSASINPLGPPPSAIAVLEKGLLALTAYPDPNYTELRSCLGQWHNLPPEWILPGNGSAELLTWACRELSQLELTYIVSPCFGDYLRAMKTFSGSVKLVQASSIELSSLGDKKPKSSRTSHGLADAANPVSSGLLLNNPHNPTGQLFSIDSILPYLDEFALVVIDEAFMDFLPPEQQQSLISVVCDYKNLVILRSLTKFYSLPGLRIGYAIAHPDRLQRYQQWRDPWPVNILAEKVACAVIQDSDFQQQTWNWLIPTKQQLFQSLSSLSGLQPLPGAANFLLVATSVPSTQLQEQLLKNHRLLIRDCLSFPELGERYFRVAVRSQPDNLLLINALATVLPGYESRI